MKLNFDLYGQDDGRWILANVNGERYTAVL